MNKVVPAYRATMGGNPFRMRSVWAHYDLPSRDREGAA
jgi:hypothetical protein